MIEWSFPACAVSMVEIAASVSMIAFALAQLSAEDPVDENHVTENDRQQHQRSHQHEDLRRRRGCGLPYRQRRWNEIGEIRDQKPEVAQQEQRDGREERENVASGLEPPPKRECDERGRGRHPPENRMFGSENHRTA